jgi:hypothetical protein
MKKLLIASVTALGLALTMAPEAKADGTAVLGVLTCTKTGKGMTYVLFSSTPVACTYDGVGGPQSYTGTSGIGFGVDIEYEEAAGIAYLVVGGSSTSKDSLNGLYLGVKGSATFGVGLTAQAGLAGAGNGFSLVPLGLGGQAGIGATAGISYLSLQGK